ncbi:MAG: RagB/SusD family nutrient uptake outer membrane protein [Bacteroidota bacterium]
MKNLVKLIIFIPLLILTSSCQEQVLNLRDPGSPTDDTFFETEAQLEVALIGVYRSLNSTPGNVPFPLLLEYTADNTYNRGNVGGANAVTTGGITSTDGIVSTFWNQFYQGIQRANNLLNNMNKAEAVTEPARFQEIRAEALFLRALFYSYLVELYGDVPFRESVATSLESLELPKTAKSVIVNNIIADLEEAADVLPVTVPASDRGRASANAANALIARIALYNEMYDVAEAAALKVMNSGETQLFSDYESLFTRAGVGSSEVLLDMSYEEGVQVHRFALQAGSRFGGWCQLVPAQQLVDNYETVNGLPIDEDPAFDPANPFENRDPRLAATIALPESEWSGHIVKIYSDSIATWRVDNGVKVARVFNPNATSTAGRRLTDPVSGQEFVTGGANRFVSFTGYFWKKFADEPALTEGGVAPYLSEQSAYLMRYAEVLLTYAEAKIETGSIDNSVLDALNEVRARGYSGSNADYQPITTTNQDELRRIVRRERRIELAGEGFRLFDIRRWGIAEKMMNTVLLGAPANGWSKIGGELGFVPNIDEDGFPDYAGAPTMARNELGNLDYRELEVRNFSARHYLWPIPQAEIDATDGLVTQNEGY